MKQAIHFLLILNLLNKTSITRNTYDDVDDANKGGKNETEIVVPLIQLSNFQRTLKTNIQNLKQKNCTLLTANQRVSIHTKI